MSKIDQEISFLNALDELIETFSNSQVPLKTHNTDGTNPLKDLISQMLETSATTTSESNYEYPEKHKLDLKFQTFIQHIETTTFHLDIIPYDKITECVFTKTPPEILNKFTDELRARGKKHFECAKNEHSIEHEKQFLKIMRHIDLALVQKNSFVNIQIKEMDKLKSDYTELNERYTKLKAEADRQYQNMLTQYISILGIFAAILMGAFGAIQAFSNLFDNADDLSLGILLIVSSIGGSSVILILFFLLNAIAKLTNRSLSSTTNNNANLFEKHPTLVITHGILTFIALIGTALELSNINLRFALQGFWWIAPSLWLVYLITSVIKRDPLFFLKIKFKASKDQVHN